MQDMHPSVEVFARNLDYLKRKAPKVAQDIISTSVDESDWFLSALNGQCLRHNGTIYKNIIFDASQRLLSQLENPKFIRTGISLGAAGLPSFLPSDVLGKHDLPILHSVFASKNAHPLESLIDPTRSQINKDVLISGMFSFAIYSSLDSLPEPHNLLSIVVAESDAAMLAYSLFLFDLPGVVARLRQRGILFKFLYAQNVSDLKDEIFVYLTAESPLSLHCLQAISSCVKYPASDLLESWMLAQSGLGQLLVGALGNTTDEINQVVNSLLNSTPGKKLFCKSPSLNSVPLVLTASGPSLDDNLSTIAQLSETAYVIAAGSSARTLLKAGINVDAIVLLERSPTLADEIEKLLVEFPHATEILVLASATVDPRIAHICDNIVFFHRPLSAALALFDSETTARLPISGPESINAAFEISIGLGFENIFLFGADFGSVDRQKPRSMDAFSYSVRPLDQPCQGSNGRTVYSQPSLLASLEALSRIIQLATDVKVYRVGEGVFIRDVQQTTPFETTAIISSLNQKSGTLYSNLHTEYSTCSVESIQHLVSELIQSNSRYVAHLSNLILSMSVWDQGYSLALNQLVGIATMPDVPCDACIYRIYRQVSFYVLGHLYFRSSLLSSKVTPDAQEEVLVYLKSVEKLINSILAALAEHIEANNVNAGLEFNPCLLGEAANKNFLQL